MERKELAEKIFDAAYITGEFLLRSGKISNEYFDKYQFEARPEILAAIAEQMAERIPAGTELLGALEMGGIPVATAISLKTGIPVVFVRKEAKEYGTCKFAEGPDMKGKRVTIVEDVVTSGGQILISTKDMRSLGAVVENAVCVIDRQSGGTEALAGDGIALNALFTMSELKA